LRLAFFLGAIVFNAETQPENEGLPSEMLQRIRKSSDIVILGSTGGLTSLTL
jgi:hypothetical protein